MKVGDPFLLGVNYWPRRKAMFMWEQFDPGEIREEFALIRSIGLTHVRLFLLWELFQPEPSGVSIKAVGELRQVADIAAELGLRLEPTLFTGHMSGPNWAPDWLLSQRARGERERWVVSVRRFTPAPTTIFNVYTEPFVLEAEKRLIRSVCGALRDHPATWAWSLGNEPDLFCRPPTDMAGREWMKTMAGAIREADPNHPVIIGFHTASIDSNPGLRVDHAAEVTDYSVMHGYPMYHGLARRPLDMDFVPFTAGLTAALAGRPVLYEEFGLCTRIPDGPSGYGQVKVPYLRSQQQYYSSEADAGAYYAEVLARLVRMGCLGAFAWCFGDYDKRLWDKPPCDLVLHERSFGLFRADGTAKPAAQTIAQFAATRPVVQESERPVMLGCSVEEYYRAALDRMRGLYERFGTLAKRLA